MSDSGTSSYIVRPAIAAEKWQIQRLLTNFAGESFRRSRWAYYLVFGVSLATVISLSFLNFLMGLIFFLSISCGITFSFTKIIFSQEWKKFWIIEQEGRIVACGKLCGYGAYSVLYDVMVLPKYRRQGIGSALVQHLSKHASKPLYLVCFPDKMGFYTQLGFIPVRSVDLSFMLRYELGIFTQPGFVPLVLR